MWRKLDKDWLCSGIPPVYVVPLCVLEAEAPFLEQRQPLPWTHGWASPVQAGFSSHPPLAMAPLCSAQPAQPQVVALTIPNLLGIGQVAEPQGLQKIFVLPTTQIPMMPGYQTFPKQPPERFGEVLEIHHKIRVWLGLFQLLPDVLGQLLPFTFQSVLV